MFRPYSPEDRALVDHYMKKMNTSSYFYSAFYVEIWKDAKDFLIWEGKHGLYIYSITDKAFFMPLSESPVRAIEELRAASSEHGLPLSFCPVPEEYIGFFDPSVFEVERKSMYDEYLYSREKLETLSGKSLQSKRNHVSRFWRENPEAEIVKIEKKHFPLLIDLATYVKDGMPEHKQSLSEEFSAFMNTLEIYEESPLEGIAIFKQDELVAFTIAEIKDDMIIIHFEKARAEITGAYQTINQEFLKRTGSEGTIVNRQEDLGLEGLKRAKLSYKPISFIKKYGIKQIN